VPGSSSSSILIKPAAACTAAVAVDGCCNSMQAGRDARCKPSIPLMCCCLCRSVCHIVQVPSVGVGEGHAGDTQARCAGQQQQKHAAALGTFLWCQRTNWTLEDGLASSCAAGLLYSTSGTSGAAAEAVSHRFDLNSTACC
jgi:hypothetical protein